MANSLSNRDAGQAIRESYDADAKAIKMLNQSGLVPENYDEILLTYVGAGNGVGEIETVVYKKDTATIATLTLSYDVNNKLSSVVRS